MKPSSSSSSSSSSRNSERVVRYAIGSRTLTITLIIIWRSLLKSYDTSSSLNPPCLSPSNSNSNSSINSCPILLPKVASAIESSVVWDSVYFLRIAQCGYEYEQIYAFFPLLPLFLSLLSHSVFRPLIPVIGYRAVLALSGYVINNLAFVLAALYFHRLSVAILKDRDLSLRATILFCFNPASIFYSSIYTESLYALFSIGGIYYLVSGADYTSVLLLSLSGFSRSNGVLNAGYCGFKTLHQAYHALFVKKRYLLALQSLLAGAFQCICICIPFVAFQAYGYYNLCHGRSPDEMRPWCRAKLPFLYNFIQSHYWGVGFLRYFQLKQIPNFLLASPVLSLAFCSVFSYVKTEPEKIFTLGFGAKENNSINVRSSKGEELRCDDRCATKQEAVSLKRRLLSVKSQVKSMGPAENQVVVQSGYYSTEMLPFIYHLSFMAATALFVMHVQVSTRFLSASPPLYWYASYVMGCIGRRRWAYLIWGYAASYILLGSLLFSNFYPFT